MTARMERYRDRIDREIQQQHDQRNRPIYGEVLLAMTAEDFSEEVRRFREQENRQEPVGFKGWEFQYVGGDEPRMDDVPQSDDMLLGLPIRRQQETA